MGAANDLLPSPRHVDRDAHQALRSVLVPIDLSPISERVLGRVRLLPLADHAKITILHVVSKRLLGNARRQAKEDARRALQAAKEAVARAVPKTIAIHHEVKVGLPATEISRHAKSVRAELIVVGRGRSHVLRDMLLGSTAERVVRRGKLPVLLVRLAPRAQYHRPAVAIDTDSAAPAALRWLLKVLPPPRPPVSVIHVYEAPFEGLIYPSLSEDDADEYREHYRHKALHEVAAILATVLAETKLPPKDSPAWRTLLRYGSPRFVIEQLVKKVDADLLVVGTHGYSGVGYAVLGTVAGDVLRAVRCDVLVVPPDASMSIDKEAPSAT